MGRLWSYCCLGFCNTLGTGGVAHLEMGAGVVAKSKSFPSYSYHPSRDPSHFKLGGGPQGRDHLDSHAGKTKKAAGELPAAFFLDPKIY